MDARRVGEALLRSHPTNFVSAVSRPSQQQLSRFPFNRRSDASRRISECSRRAFSTSSTRTQQNAPKNDDPQSQQSAQQPSQSSSQRPLAELRDLINRASNTGASEPGTTRPSTGGSEGGQRQTSLFGSDKQAVARTNSVEDASAKRADSKVIALRQMLGKTILSNRGASLSRSKWKCPSEATIQTTTKQSLMAPPDLTTLPRLGPSYGRTVPIKNGDLVGGLRTMDMRINANGIRKAYHAQRFHERPGLKRKRLASQRWRKRFMQGFKATVNTVKHLKKQGW